MVRKKITAKEAVADIRSGMDDAALMRKYGVSPQGLQSLFDKLVSSGFIDFGEMQNRLSGFWGTLVVPEANLFPDGRKTKDPPIKSNASRIVGAQGAARDIRSGMADSALMEKYGLSSKGLSSLFDKLMALGLLTQADLDRRHLEIGDRTVDLREERLSFSQALDMLGRGSPPASNDKIRAQVKESKVHDIVKGSTVNETPPFKRNNDGVSRETNRDSWIFGLRWYERPVILALLLVCLFPLGFYALYRNSILSTGIKAFITVSWIMLTVVSLVVISEVI